MSTLAACGCVFGDIPGVPQILSPTCYVHNRLPFTDKNGHEYTDWERRAIFNPHAMQDFADARVLLGFSSVDAGVTAACDTCGAVHVMHVPYLIKHREQCGWPPRT